MSVIKIPPLHLKELVKRLGRFGLICRSGKGSEVVVTGHIFEEHQTLANFRRYRIGTHGSSKHTSPVISGHTIEAILRRFKIKRDDFLADVH